MIVWQYDCVVVWLCSCMTYCLCGCATIYLYDHVTLLQNCCMAVCLYMIDCGYV